MKEEKTIKLNRKEKDQLDRWVQKMLLPPEEWEVREKYARSPVKKGEETYIQDSIWGNIEIRKHELALLNTPLLQRLRRIKQLSSGSLFFPGATHTRFEHSLGVLEQTDRMCQWLMKKGKVRPKKVDLTRLRFAALCHDLGHGPFSHDSEAFFKNLPPFRRKKKAKGRVESRRQSRGGLKTESNEGQSGSAEDLSAFIVRSEPFKDFCKQLRQGLDVEFIAKAITGCLPPKKKYLGDIIKGSFDADKIDYLTRDGQYCGVPIEIDMQLIHRSLAVSEEGGALRLAGEPKAGPALIQLSRHRQYMFTAVYHHKVARIFKAMFVKALECAYERNAKVNGKPLETAFDFLELDNEMLFTPGIVSEGRAADLLARLRDRNLFKIALEFGNYPNCMICKRFKQYNDCARCREIQEEKRDEIRDTCDYIAKEAGMKLHHILFSETPAITHKEADKMLLSKDRKTIRLGAILDLQREGDVLQGFGNNDLLCCPVEYVEKVREIARRKLGKYEFES